MSIKHRIVTVTPKLATEWLTNFGDGNRPLSDHHVRELRDRMTQGMWRLNGQSLIFGSNDKLLDGQHRLRACIAAEVSFETGIVEGVDPAAFSTIDDGRKRSAGDVLALQGYDFSIPLASAARWFIRYTTSAMRSGAVPNNVDVLSIVAANDDLVKAIAVIAPQKNDLGLGRGLLAAFFCIFARIDAVDAERFLAGLMTGTNLGEGSPILVIRARFQDAKNPRFRMGSRVRLTDLEKAALITKAWNKFRDDIPTRQLRFRNVGTRSKREPFPVAH